MVRSNMFIRTIHSPAWSCHPIGGIDLNTIDPSVRDAQLQAWSVLDHASKTVDMLTVENGFVAARGLIYSSDKRLVAQSVGVHHEVDATNAMISRLEAPHAHLDGRHLLLKRPGSSCYGHWLIEILPVLEIFRSIEKDPVKVIVQRLDGGMRSVVHQTLALMDIPSQSIVETRVAVYGVDVLHAVYNATETGRGFSPLILDAFAKISDKIEAGSNKRIFIERKRTGTRSILNQMEVRAAMERNGFLVVRPEQFSFAEQVALFKGAEVVVGTTGSALTNVVFCGSNAKVLALAPAPIIDNFYWNLCNLCGISYHEVRFPVKKLENRRHVYDEPMVVDISELNRAVNSL